MGDLSFQYGQSSDSLLPEAAFPLVLLHLLHRSSEGTSSSSKLTCHQGTITSVLEVILQDTPLTVLFARIRVWADNWQFVQKTFEDQVGGGAGHLIERLPTDRTGGVHPQVGGDAGLTECMGAGCICGRYERLKTYLAHEVLIHVLRVVVDMWLMV